MENIKFLTVLMASFLAFSAKAEDRIQGEEIAVLTDAPEVPPQITRKYPTKVIVNLEVKEVKKRLADGVE